jgi:serine protease Do
VITAVAGQPVKNANELIKKIQATAPGSSVELATLRQGKERKLNVGVAQLPEQPSGTVGLAK